MIPDADLMKWKGYVFDIVTPTSKRCAHITRAPSPPPPPLPGNYPSIRSSKHAEEII
jgi:hypothetical protein